MAQNSTYVLAEGKNGQGALDTLHDAIDNYLGHKLTPAPLGHPRRILELGAGSGAWAIQAAKQFPEAAVIAADMSPLPPRPTPTNLKFIQADITQTLPFEPESFDIVHLRFVLFHIPHGITLVPKLAQLVAPGGLLLIVDGGAFDVTGDDAPAVRRCSELLTAYMRSKHQDPRIADILETQLRTSGLFSDVGAHRVCLPLNTPVADPAVQQLSKVFADSFKRVLTGEVPPEVRAAGLTQELQQACQEEVDVKEWDSMLDVVWTWSRKPVDAVTL
ncbi:S-adenosyl-L-methionine-dependent methyltransferase [Dentipellis sp. KUC8613]|nr:S-adenosyl-L-methionine-dependent methyltransferase [Dentipellis sp. KUC8613]